VVVVVVVAVVDNNNDIEYDKVIAVRSVLVQLLQQWFSRMM
jgi:hypothetical protein